MWIIQILALCNTGNSLERSAIIRLLMPHNFLTSIRLITSLMLEKEFLKKLSVVSCQIDQKSTTMNCAKGFTSHLARKNGTDLFTNFLYPII